MILEKFRSGLLGRFVKFGVVPSVLVVVTIVSTTTYLNIAAKFEDLRELATSHAEFFGRAPIDSYATNTPNMGLACATDCK